MKAVFLDYETMGPGLDLEPLSSLVDSLTLYDSTEQDQLAERAGDAEIVFTNKFRFDDATLEKTPKLRFIGLTATGADNVDLDGATRAGITVSNIRAYCTQSVVEHVMGFLLMASHRLDRYAQYVADGHWQTSSQFNCFDWPFGELKGKTLGIVGYGELGQGVARAAEQFGMTILIAARPGQEPVPDGRVAFVDVLQRSDAVTLHCPLNPSTKNLMNKATLAFMKQGAWLLNTARGGLVDSAALVHALESGHLGGAALDVLPQEPPTDGDPLLDYEGDNLIITPHVAWASIEARQNAIQELARNTEAFLNGEPRNQLA